MLLWAGNAVVGRVASQADVSPIALNFWRWSCAFLILAPLTARTLYAQRDLLKTHWRHWVAFGIVTVVGFNCAYYIGLQYTTVVQGTLISAALPILVLVAVRLFLAQPILIRFVPKSIDLMAFQMGCFVAGLVVLAPFYVYDTMGGRPMPLTWSAALLVGYAALAASVVGLTCWNTGVMRVGSKTARYLANLFPLFGAALGILLLGEPFQWFHAVGGAFTLAGIALATIAPQREAARPSLTPT